MKRIITAVSLILLFFTSCKIGTGVKSASGNPILVKYEVTGSFTGTLFASYTTASGDTANEEVISLPWSKEITYASNAATAVISISGNGDTADQKVTVAIKKISTQVSPAPVSRQQFWKSFTGCPRYHFLIL